MFKETPKIVNPRHPQSCHPPGFRIFQGRRGLTKIRIFEILAFFNFEGGLVLFEKTAHTYIGIFVATPFRKYRLFAVCFFENI